MGIPFCCGKPMQYVGTITETVRTLFGGTKKVTKKQYWCRKCDSYKNV